MTRLVRLDVRAASLACLAAAVVPAVAAAQTVTAPAMVMSSPTAASSATAAAAADVAAFYARTPQVHIWVRNGAIDEVAAARLSAILVRATVEGLAEGPMLAAAVDAAAAGARSGDKAAQARAEQVMSTSWLRYARLLNTVPAGFIWGDPYRRPQPETVDRTLGKAWRAPELAPYLDAASNVNPVYGPLRDLLAATPSALDDHARASLERARMFPSSGRFAVVDAASATLRMYDGGREVDRMNLVVGKPELPTPMIVSTISYAQLNPYWHVPDHLARKNVSRLVLAQGKPYLKAKGYEVVNDWNDPSPGIDWKKIDWKGVNAGTVHVRIRQLPGKENFMGKVKYPFPNGEDIYLHDSPEKDLFLKAKRDLSNGCIRLEDAQRFGRWLFDTQPMPVISGTAPEQNFTLPRGVPVYVTYLTVHAEGGKLTRLADIYGRDVGAGTAQGGGQ